MNEHTQAASEIRQRGISSQLRVMNWERVGVLFARVALGVAFLSAVVTEIFVWQHGRWTNPGWHTDEETYR